MRSCLGSKGAAATWLLAMVGCAPAASEDAGWAVEYGREFWRRPAVRPQAVAAASPSQLPAGVDLGDILDRTSHAF
jgi:hypothetical protein